MNQKIEIDTDFIINIISCPLTCDIFIDPVIASDSITYERHAIQQWYNKHHISPTTTERLDGTFYTNSTMKQLVSKFLILYPEYNKR